MANPVDANQTSSASSATPVIAHRREWRASQTPSAACAKLCE